MNKQTKRIVACFSVVVVLIIAFAIPTFAYYDSQNVNLGNRAYYSNYPIRFTRAVITADGVQNPITQAYTDTWISEVDLPTEYNTAFGNGISHTQKQELLNPASDSQTVGRGYATTYTTYFNDTFKSELGCNIHNPIVSESSHHRLDIYADVGIFTKEEIDNGFYIILNDVKNITRSRISFDLLVPTAEIQGITDDIYNIEFVSNTVTVQCDIVEIGENEFTYKLFDFEDIQSYYSDEFYNFDELPTTPILITNVRYTAIFDRNSGGTDGSNYDFSFLIEYNENTSNGSLIALRNLTLQAPVYPENVTISFNDISVVEWAITQINSILTLELIPYVSIGAILWFVVGLSLFFFTLKMFLGG